MGLIYCYRDGCLHRLYTARGVGVVEVRVTGRVERGLLRWRREVLRAGVSFKVKVYLISVGLRGRRDCTVPMRYINIFVFMIV
jgi:hypothetical protein